MPELTAQDFIKKVRREGDCYVISDIVEAICAPDKRTTAFASLAAVVHDLDGYVKHGETFGHVLVETPASACAVLSRVEGLTASDVLSAIDAITEFEEIDVEDTSKEEDETEDLQLLVKRRELREKDLQVAARILDLARTHGGGPNDEQRSAFMDLVTAALQEEL